MVYALIIAGGTGSRMGQDIPKQFIHVFDRPVLIYTLEAFQKHPQIDGIAVVCIDGWKQVLEAYAKQFCITKLKKIIDGGKTAQESIKNGVFALEKELKNEDILVIHDGIRPLVKPEVLSDVIAVCAQKGNAVTSMPYNEQIFKVSAQDQSTTTEYIPRETVRRVSTPQAYRFDLIDNAYHEAFERKVGIYGSSYANTMLVELGYRLNFASGSDKNIKLTTPEDLETFKAYLMATKDHFLKDA